MLAALSAVFVASLITLMFSLYLAEPRARPLDATLALIDDQGQPVDQSLFKGPSLAGIFRVHALPGGLPYDAL
ncbi:hypothetical protein AOG23_30980 [Rhizobium acidisoli]|nr:hypothetical protein AOG23_30980 [Rhizobium acidisoli]